MFTDVERWIRMDMDEYVRIWRAQTNMMDSYIDAYVLEFGGNANWKCSVRGVCVCVCVLVGGVRVRFLSTGGFGGSFRRSSFCCVRWVLGNCGRALWSGAVVGVVVACCGQGLRSRAVLEGCGRV